MDGARSFMMGEPSELALESLKGRNAAASACSRCDCSIEASESGAATKDGLF